MPLQKNKYDYAYLSKENRQFSLQNNPSRDVLKGNFFVLFALSGNFQNRSENLNFPIEQQINCFTKSQVLRPAAPNCP